ncbi:MAG: hypothetical protein ACI89T_001006 [Cognaticolwellia sp.]|jgi:hypothetical protein
MPLIMSIAGVSLSATAAVIGSQLEQKLQNMTAQWLSFLMIN